MQAISSADMVVIMEKGHVKWVGSPNDLPVSSYITFSPLNELDSDVQNQGQPCSTNPYSKLKELPDGDIKQDLEREEETIEVESRKEGKVELGVYK